jgi:hypothetical protein
MSYYYVDPNVTASPMRTEGNISGSMALLYFDYQQGGECGVSVLKMLDYVLSRTGSASSL